MTVSVTTRLPPVILIADIGCGILANESDADKMNTVMMTVPEVVVAASVLMEATIAVAVMAVRVVIAVELGEQNVNVCIKDCETNGSYERFLRTKHYEATGADYVGDGF